MTMFSCKINIWKSFAVKTKQKHWRAEESKHSFAERAARSQIVYEPPAVDEETF